MTKTSPRSLRVAAVLAILSTIGIAGCGNPTQKTAENYLNDLKLRGYSAIYGMLSHQDQVDRAIEDFLKDIPLAPDVSKDWFKPVLQETQFELGDAKMEGDSKAVVPVKVTMPDLALWERTIDAGIGNSGPADAEAQKSLQDQKYPKISYDDALVLVKEGS